MLAGMNVPAPTASAYLAALSEFAGGLLIALGILPRLAAIPFAITMVVAWATAHHGKFFSQTGGGEYPLTLAVMAIVVVIAGPGRYSLPRLVQGGRS
jgi:putative oxidoreductase